jgi:hypothetical protein
MPKLKVEIELSDRALEHFWKLSKRLAIGELGIPISEKETICLSAEQIIDQDVEVYAELMSRIAQCHAIAEANIIWRG